MHAPLNVTPLNVTPMKFKPMMRVQSKKTLVAMIAFGTAASLFTGCKRNVEKADEAVTAVVAKAQNELRHRNDMTAGGSPANPLSTIAGAANQHDASAPAQATANLVAGHAELMVADDLIHQIDDVQTRLQSLLDRIDQMTVQVERNNVSYGGLAMKDPKASLAVIDKTTTAAKTGEAGVWLASSDAASIPALDAVEKKIADLTQQSNDLKARLADLDKQRTDALQKSEQFASQSETAKGKESLDLYTQASNFRKTAGDLSTQSADTQLKLDEALRNLSVVQGQKEQLDVALTTFADQSKQVSGGWQNVRKLMEDLTAKSKAILEGDSAAQPATVPMPMFRLPPTRLLPPAIRLKSCRKN